MSELDYDQTSSNGPWTFVEEYIYVDASGEPQHKIDREENGKLDDNGKPEKRFIQSYNPGGEMLHVGTPLERPDWQYGQPKKVMPYELDKFTRAASIMLVEGERVANYVNAKLGEAGFNGILATTAPGGANAWKKSLAKYFKPHRVYLYPDRDAPGYKHMMAAARDISAAGAPSTSRART
jgi:hypothetical protein